MESSWLNELKRLHAIAATGRNFCDSEYDRERYEEALSIAGRLLADLGGTSIDRINNLVPEYAKGYATPKIDVRGALIDGDRILLVKEATDEKWTLPGGYAEVGITPARNVEKEMFEEAHVKVTAKRLYAVRHKAAHAYKPDVRDFYKMFFLCEADSPVEPAPGIETLDVGWFTLESLPPLSRGRIIEADLVDAFKAKPAITWETRFD
ncbi:MAG: NUDIX hydrolase N-terminal domain-containing protein [Pseudomonadota bacterium]